MIPVFIAIVLLASVSARVNHRPIKIIGYPYIPDLNGDQLVGLADFMQDKFYSDTGRQIEILYDFTYATDTYTPSLVVDALSPTGGYDMQEIDTIILGYLVNHDAIQRPPANAHINEPGYYTPQIVSMVSDPYGTIWAAPSYTCTNIYFSYDSSITANHDGTSFIHWMNNPKHRKNYPKGWTGDLSSEPDLRLEYLAGWKNSHPTQTWEPVGYSSQLSLTDMDVVNNIKVLRNNCTDPAHTNYCVDGTFYNNPDQWFYDFVNGGTLVLQGFPEYTSEILKRANTDPNNPTRLHTVTPALIGNGDTPFLFTDAWVISKSNCDNDCQTTAAIFLNWQRTNWASVISLGQDLFPVRPRFLAVAYQPFYCSEEVDALPQFAKDYYSFTNSQINRGFALDTVNFWGTEDAQSATIESLITVGYNP